MGSIWTRIKAKWSSTPCKGLILHFASYLGEWSHISLLRSSLGDRGGGGYKRVSPWPSLLGSLAVLITYFVCARTRRHLGDCWLAGQSRGVKADTEVKDKNFLYVGQVSSQNPHFIHLLGWCNIHLGIRHDIILLLPFLYSFMFLPPFNSTISFCPHKDNLARQGARSRRKHREIKQMT